VKEAKEKWKKIKKPKPRIEMELVMQRQQQQSSRQQVKTPFIASSFLRLSTSALRACVGTATLTTYPHLVSRKHQIGVSELLGAACRVAIT
jgi:hypothetical protein